MTSFFDKLSQKLTGGKGRRAPDPMAFFTADPKRPEPPPAPPGTASEEEILQSQRLDVDVYQDPGQICIYALAAGVDPSDFDITLDEENDLLAIRGVRKRPDPPKQEKAEAGELLGKFVQEECSWEPFFRKIVLPGEVDIIKAEAVLRKGILIITLPLLRTTEGRKLKVTEILSGPAPGPKS
jgi:HSP20 family molecular chaperone IbpA